MAAQLLELSEQLHHWTLEAVAAIETGAELPALLEAATEMTQGALGLADVGFRLCREMTRASRPPDRDGRTRRLVALRGARGEEAEENPEAGQSVFRRDADVWVIRYEGRTTRLKSCIGLACLAYLLRRPGEKVAALELWPQAQLIGSSPGRRRKADDGATAADQPSAARRERFALLRDELEMAEEHNDPGRAEKLRAEIEALRQECLRTFGYGRPKQRVGSPGERARVNVTRAISYSIRKIAQHDPPLALYLSGTMRTGTFCSYSPDPRALIEWQL